MKRKSDPEEGRRDYLKTVGGLVVGLAVGGAAGWLSKPVERVEVPGVTVTAPGATETVTKTVTAPITPTPTPEKVETIVFGSGYDPRSMDPAKTGGFPMYNAIIQVYDPLIITGVGGLPAPHIATSWDVSEDGRTYTFKIRRGVKFHDGSTLDAEAVRYTFVRMLTINEVPVSFYAAILKPENIKTLDKYTVSVTLDKVFAPFLFSIAGYVRIVNPKLIEENKKPEGPYGEHGDFATEWLETHDAGSGPYMLVERKMKEKLTFERFPDYWEGWRPKYFGKGIYQVIRESATMKVLLQNREIDYTDQWQGVKFYDEVEKFPGVKVYRDPQISALQVFLNGRNEFISNKDFRYALCYAFPYEDVLREVFMGRFPKMKGPLPASIWSHTSDLMVFNHDMEKAREYFDKSGFSEGEVELGWVDVGIEERRRIGLIYQEKLAELGINLRIDKIEWAALQDVTSKLETTPDTMIILRGIPYGDPDAYMYHHYHSSVWKTHPSYISMCRYENAEVDKLLDQAREIVDIGKRTELYVKAQKIIAEDAPAIYIHDGIREVAMQESVQGYSAFGNPSFYTSLNWRWNNWWRA